MRSTTTLRLFGLALFVLIVTLIWTALAPLRADGHTGHEIEAWLEDFGSVHYHNAGGPFGAIEADLARAELRTFIDAHPWYFNPPPPEPISTAAASPPIPTPVPQPAPPAAVESWRSLVAVYFAPGDVDRALCLMAFESGGDPNAYNPSTATGLMQVKAFWAASFGYQPADLFDPAINLEVAAGVKAAQGWTAWSPYNRGECR